MVSVSVSDTAQSNLLRKAGLAYGVIAYLMAIGFWPLFICFIGNLFRIYEPWLERTVSVAPVILPTSQALAIDVALIAAFALHHSFLARPAIKKIWWRFVPEPFRRATFSHLANFFAFALVLAWQPIPIVIWQFDIYSPLRKLILLPFGIAWLMLLIGAASFNLAALFGLRQVWFWYQGRRYEPIDITTGPIYHMARHPEFLGVFVGVWFTPDMTAGHLLLAVSFTAYSLIALRVKERELAKSLGGQYTSYLAKVPMLGPRWAVATALGLGFGICAIGLLEQRQQTQIDAQAQSDLTQLAQALGAYKAKHGAYPPSHGTGDWECEHPALKARYDGLMAALQADGVLAGPLGHPARADKKGLGYCFAEFAVDGRAVHIVWGLLPSTRLGNAGEPGGCRPVKQDGLCSATRANHDFCLCLP